MTKGATQTRLSEARLGLGLVLISGTTTDTITRMLDFTGHPSLIPEAEFCGAAGFSSKGLERALFAKRVFAVEKGGQPCFPDFYLDKRYGRRQLQAVCKLLGDLPGGSKLQFFTTPKGSLNGRTPLDALADGDFALVRRTAEGFAEG